MVTSSLLFLEATEPLNRFPEDSSLGPSGCHQCPSLDTAQPILGPEHGCGSQLGLLFPLAQDGISFRAGFKTFGHLKSDTGPRREEGAT